MRHAIGQQIIIGIRGLSLEKDEADFIVKNNIGGVIFFARNCESPKQLHDLCLQIQGLRNRMPDKAPLFVSIDMEGGRVLRLKPPFTPWPAAAQLGKIDSTSVAFKFALSMGAEMRAVGINLDFAPCIDIFSNPKNTVIGDRAISSQPEPVGRLGSAMVRGYLKADVLTCAKHFPGHGNTLLDSHQALPIEEKSLEELESFELEPFKKVFKAKLDFVMPTHIKYPKIDPDWPVSLSEIFLKYVLRERLRYRGMIVTDDLDMKALTLNFDKATIAKRALQVGSNILLYCNEPESPVIALDAIEKAVRDGELQESMIRDNHAKVLHLKRERLQNTDPLSMDDISRIVGHPDHLRLAKAISAGTVPADLLA
jgi:beta-N-acetylhexosaminidase